MNFPKVRLQVAPSRYEEAIQKLLPLIPPDKNQPAPDDLLDKSKQDYSQLLQAAPASSDTPDLPEEAQNPPLDIGPITPPVQTAPKPLRIQSLPKRGSIAAANQAASKGISPIAQATAQEAAIQQQDLLAQQAAPGAQASLQAGIGSQPVPAPPSPSPISQDSQAGLSQQLMAARQAPEDIFQNSFSIGDFLKPQEAYTQFGPSSKQIISDMVTTPTSFPVVQPTEQLIENVGQPTVSESPYIKTDTDLKNEEWNRKHPEEKKNPYKNLELTSAQGYDPKKIRIEAARKFTRDLYGKESIVLPETVDPDYPGATKADMNFDERFQRDDDKYFALTKQHLFDLTVPDEKNPKVLRALSAKEHEEAITGLNDGNRVNIAVHDNNINELRRRITELHKNENPAFPTSEERLTGSEQYTPGEAKFASSLAGIDKARRESLLMNYGPLAPLNWAMNKLLPEQQITPEDVQGTSKLTESQRSQLESELQGHKAFSAGAVNALETIAGSLGGAGVAKAGLQTTAKVLSPLIQEAIMKGGSIGVPALMEAASTVSSQSGENPEDARTLEEYRKAGEGLGYDPSTGESIGKIASPILRALKTAVTLEALGGIDSFAGEALKPAEQLIGKTPYVGGLAQQAFKGVRRAGTLPLINKTIAGLEGKDYGLGQAGLDAITSYALGTGHDIAEAHTEGGSKGVLKSILQPSIEHPDNLSIAGKDFTPDEIVKGQQEIINNIKTMTPKQAQELVTHLESQELPHGQSEALRKYTIAAGYNKLGIDPNQTAITADQGVIPEIPPPPSYELQLPSDLKSVQDYRATDPSRFNATETSTRLQKNPLLELQGYTGEFEQGPVDIDRRMENSGLNQQIDDLHSAGWTPDRIKEYLANHPVGQESAAQLAAEEEHKAAIQPTLDEWDTIASKIHSPALEAIHQQIRATMKTAGYDVTDPWGYTSEDVKKIAPELQAAYENAVRRDIDTSKTKRLNLRNATPIIPRRQIEGALNGQLEAPIAIDASASPNLIERDGGQTPTPDQIGSSASPTEASGLPVVPVNESAIASPATEGLRLVPPTRKVFDVGSPENIARKNGVDPIALRTALTEKSDIPIIDTGGTIRTEPFNFERGVYDDIISKLPSKTFIDTAEKLHGVNGPNRDDLAKIHRDAVIQSVMNGQKVPDNVLNAPVAIESTMYGRESGKGQVNLGPTKTLREYIDNIQRQRASITSEQREKLLNKQNKTAEEKAVLSEDESPDPVIHPGQWQRNYIPVDDKPNLSIDDSRVKGIAGTTDAQGERAAQIKVGTKTVELRNQPANRTNSELEITGYKKFLQEGIEEDLRATQDPNDPNHQLVIPALLNEIHKASVPEGRPLIVATRSDGSEIAIRPFLQGTGDISYRTEARIDPQSPWQPIDESTLGNDYGKASEEFIRRYGASSDYDHHDPNVIDNTPFIEDPPLTNLGLDEPELQPSSIVVPQSTDSTFNPEDRLQLISQIGENRLKGKTGLVPASEPLKAATPGEPHLSSTALLPASEPTAGVASLTKPVEDAGKRIDSDYKGGSTTAVRLLPPIPAMNLGEHASKVVKFLGDVFNVTKQVPETFEAAFGTVRENLRRQLPELGYSEDKADQAYLKYLEYQIQHQSSRKQAVARVEKWRKMLKDHPFLDEVDKGLITKSDETIDRMGFRALEGISHFDQNGLPVGNTDGEVFDHVNAVPDDPKDLTKKNSITNVMNRRVKQYQVEDALKNGADSKKLEAEVKSGKPGPELAKGQRFKPTDFNFEHLGDGTVRVRAKYTENPLNLYARAVTGKGNAVYNDLEEANMGGKLETDPVIKQILQEMDSLRRDTAIEQGITPIMGYMHHYTTQPDSPGWHKVPRLSANETTAAPKFFRSGYLKRTGKVTESMFGAMEKMHLEFAREKAQNDFAKGIMDILSSDTPPEGQENQFTNLRAVKEEFGQKLVKLSEQRTQDNQQLMLSKMGFTPENIQRLKGLGFKHQAGGVFMPNVAMSMLRLGVKAGELHDTSSPWGWLEGLKDKHEGTGHILDMLHGGLHDLTTINIINHLSGAASGVRDLANAYLQQHPIKTWEQGLADGHRFLSGELPFREAFRQTKQNLKAPFISIPRELGEAYNTVLGLREQNSTLPDYMSKENLPDSSGLMGDRSKTRLGKLVIPALQKLTMIKAFCDEAGRRMEYDSHIQEWADRQIDQIKNDPINKGIDLNQARQELLKNVPLSVKAEARLKGGEFSFSSDDINPGLNKVAASLAAKNLLSDLPRFLIKTSTFWNQRMNPAAARNVRGLQLETDPTKVVIGAQELSTPEEIKSKAEKQIQEYYNLFSNQISVRLRPPGTNDPTVIYKNELPDLITQKVADLTQEQNDLIEKRQQEIAKRNLEEKRQTYARLATGGAAWATHFLGGYFGLKGIAHLTEDEKTKPAKFGEGLSVSGGEDAAGNRLRVYLGSHDPLMEAEGRAQIFESAVKTGLNHIPFAGLDLNTDNDIQFHEFLRNTLGDSTTRRLLDKFAFNAAPPNQSKYGVGDFLYDETKSRVPLLNYARSIRNQVDPNAREVHSDSDKFLNLLPYGHQDMPIARDRETGDPIDSAGNSVLQRLKPFEDTSWTGHKANQAISALANILLPFDVRKINKIESEMSTEPGAHTKAITEDTVKDLAVKSGSPLLGSESKEVTQRINDELLAKQPERYQTMRAIIYGMPPNIPVTVNWQKMHETYQGLSEDGKKMLLQQAAGEAGFDFQDVVKRVINEYNKSQDRPNDLQYKAPSPRVIAYNSGVVADTVKAVDDMVKSPAFRNLSGKSGFDLKTKASEKEVATKFLTEAFNKQKIKIGVPQEVTAATDAAILTKDQLAKAPAEIIKNIIKERLRRQSEESIIRGKGASTREEKPGDINVIQDTLRKLNKNPKQVKFDLSQ